ncbi:alkaline phosphatase family protein [Aestuariivirga sp.]|uniref:alkaline phosphatase family protein n=1 Tax=Aestuariivirga sp. TaxID=2650926 RepID=UPI0039E3B67C
MKVVPDKPNVLLICADQWRGDCIGALGHPNVRTHNLDQLMKKSVTFTRHYGQCTPCGPSRTSLLTGMYLMNHRSGRNGTPLDARHTNLALEARKLGYEPSLFGYTDTTPDPRLLHPNDPSLKAYDEGVLPGFSTPLHLPEDMGKWISHLKALGYDIPGGRADVFRPRPQFDKPADRGFRFIPTSFKAEHSETAFLTDEFLKWLLVREAKPWFAHFVFFRPHPPFIAPEPYNAAVHPNDVSFPVRKESPELEGKQHPLLAHEISNVARTDSFDEHNPMNLVEADDLEIRQMKSTYFGLIEEMDHHLGRIISYLEATGQLERTLIIVTSDHAEMLGDHYVWGKEIYFDGSFHLPLVIFDPSRAADATRGTRVDRFTEAIDIMPTILDWLGAGKPRSVDGHSLVHFLHGTAVEHWRDAVFFEHDFRNVRSQRVEKALGISSDECSYAVVRDSRFKYIHFTSLPPLLFDLTTDPTEMNNLAGRREYAAVELSYAQKLLSWRLLNQERVLTNMHIGEGGLYVHSP